jgi:hypothetical protein
LEKEGLASFLPMVQVTGQSGSVCCSHIVKACDLAF